MSAEQPKIPSFDYVKYSTESTLNGLHVWLPESLSLNQGPGLWLIYIHGGAWRDPDILASSFDNIRKLLLQSEAISKICGLASIDYRLSPYPAHSTNPSDPHDPARNAIHPDHINDVLHAILTLQRKHGFEDRYILVGHSCGATLALQVAMRRYWGSQYESSFADELNVVPPLAIVGVDGIYDLSQLVREYAQVPEYLDFVKNAFGSSEQIWEESSPANGDYAENWPDGRLLVLIHSDADELLSGKQRQIMLRSIKDSAWATHSDHEIRSLDIYGLKHDEIWQSPAQLVSLLNRIIEDVYTYR